MTPLGADSGSAQLATQQHLQLLQLVDAAGKPGPAMQFNKLLNSALTVPATKNAEPVATAPRSAEVKPEVSSDRLTTSVIRPITVQSSPLKLLDAPAVYRQSITAPRAFEGGAATGSTALADSSASRHQQRLLLVKKDNGEQVAYLGVDENLDTVDRLNWIAYMKTIFKNMTRIVINGK